MNTINLDRLMRNYLDEFKRLNQPPHIEYYKWDAVRHFQDHYDPGAADFSAMLKEAGRKTYNLVDSTIRPLSAAVKISREEPDVVRSLFESLFAEDGGDLDARHERILDFVSRMNELKEKYYPGSWMYEYSHRSAINLLALRRPDENFFFKSTNAREFARVVEFGTDIGSGINFKLKHYYGLCEQVAAAVRANADLLAVHPTRFPEPSWPDEPLHILTYDIIYCVTNYELYKDVSYTKQQRRITPPPIKREREELLRLLDEAKAKLEDLVLPSCIGQTLTHEIFGEGKVLEQDELILDVQFADGVKKLGLPNNFVDDLMVIEEHGVRESYLKLHDLNESIKSLNMKIKIWDAVHKVNKG